MNLANDVEDIREGIRVGRYGNEAAISQGIVLRLLQALGWPTYDTQIVCPEFTLGGRRVDFGLCYPPNKPIAFIEVKRIGQSDGAERQLFEYAFHEGVPLAILTDGQEWNFFLPAGQGAYAERRVYKLDILERDLPESVARLERYLSYKQISSGAAVEAATQDYRNVARSRQVASHLPEALSKLVSEEDELLLELVADKVESLCGFKPDLDTVAKFLREDVAIKSGATPATFVKPTRSFPDRIEHKEGHTAESVGGPKFVGFTLDGHFVPGRNGRDVLVGVFEALAARDSTFLERFASRPKHGRTRRYLARSPEKLYPGREDLASEHSFKLKSGWYVGTNVSHAQIERIIEMACEVSNIRLGRELVVNIGV
jgi:hypothetical protein